MPNNNNDWGSAIGSALTNGINAYVGMKTMINKDDYERARLQEVKDQAAAKAAAEQAASESMLQNAVTTGLLSPAAADKVRGTGVSGTELLKQLSMVAPYVSKQNTTRATAGAMPDLGVNPQTVPFGADIAPRLSGYSTQTSADNNNRSNSTQLALGQMTTDRSTADNQAAMERAQLSGGRPLVAGNNMIVPVQDTATGNFSYTVQPLPVQAQAKDYNAQAKALVDGSLEQLKSINSQMGKPEYAALDPTQQQAIATQAQNLKRQFHTGLQMLGESDPAKREALFQSALAQPKKLDRTTAQQYLQKAGGDPEKARALAKTDGWSF